MDYLTVIAGDDGLLRFATWSGLDRIADHGKRISELWFPPLSLLTGMGFKTADTNKFAAGINI